MFVEIDIQSLENFDEAWAFLKMSLEILIHKQPDPERGEFTFSHIIEERDHKNLKIVLSPEELATLPQKKEKWEQLGILDLTEAEVQALKITEFSSSHRARILSVSPDSSELLTDQEADPPENAPGDT